MKYVQIIDSAENCAYFIYAVTDEEFRLIFPAQEQDIEFINDIAERLSEAQFNALFTPIWERSPMYKADVCGIHGTLFYQCDHKRKYYPNKKESDLYTTVPRFAPAPERQKTVESKQTSCR